MIDVIRLLVKLGLQSVAAHKRKSIIVGGLMAFGAFIVVAGTSLMSSIETSMRTSIVESVTGDIQVYDKNAKDELEIFGGFGFGSVDLGEIKKFSDVRDALMKHPNVKAVVPMGIANAQVSTPGDLDRALNSLRDAVRSGEDAQPAVDQVRRLVGIMIEQRKREAEISAGAAAKKESDEILAWASSDALWSRMATEPLAVLDQVETKLGPLGDDGNQIYLRLVGTDLDAFRTQFAKMKVIQGQMVPPHQRGLVIGQKFLDKRMKQTVAMNLDTINEELAKGKTIATDTVLQETVQKNVRIASRLLYDFSPADAQIVEQKLREALPGTQAKDLAAVLQEFLKTDDANFASRYQIFYDVVGSRIQLYPFKVGDTITLTSFTKTGFLRSVNVKIYGTYAFEGLESSDLAGALSLVDIMSFRDLYGARTAEFDAELAAMKKSVGAADLSRDEAEAAMFGGSDTLEVKQAQATETKDEAVLSSASDREKRVLQSTFTQADVDNGIALSAAVLLKDGSQLWQSLGEISALGEPVGVKAVDWQRAAGIIGQFIWVIRGVLTIALLIIFAVTIVIINNSMVMATLERVAEIGTMRAIGAQKSFVTLMIIFEMAVLGIAAGGGGALLAAAFMTWLNSAGIPAGNDVLVFLFGGPELYPTVTLGHIGTAMVATVVVSVAATLYPARLATRIQPVVAMQGKE